MKPSRPGRWQWVLPLLGVFAGVIFAAYVAQGLFLYAYQRHYLYIPVPGEIEAPAAYGLPYVQDVTVKTEDGLSLRTWFMPPPPHRPVILFFHGNQDNLITINFVFPFYRLRHYGVFACEYRGYSRNPGEPSEQGINTDARACVAWLKDHGYGMDRIAFYGVSLGTAVALQAAMETPPKALVLQSPFTSFTALAKRAYRNYPVDLMVTDPWDNLSKIGKVHSALLILHGTADDLIPIAMSRSLFAAANEPKTYVEIAGAGHNDMYKHGTGTQITAWLDRQLTGEKHDNGSGR